jgi:transposase-like protein
METRNTPTAKSPKTLLEAVRYFADVDVATAFVAKLRWPDGPTCPRCGCREYSFLKTRRLWKCKSRECRYQYSAKKGTIFEDSPLGFDKWLPAVWLVVNCKNGVSSHELARAIGVHQESAWHMLHRVRVAMELGTFEKLSGEVEADESYVGGLGKFMHPAKRQQLRGTGGKDKTPVMGMLERDGKLVAKVVQNTKRSTLQGEVRRHIASGSSVYSDNLRSYIGLEADYDRGVIDHAVADFSGRIHTNGLENFWSLLKRSLKGTYVSVQPEHLNAYVAEQVLRYNQRKDTDAGRFQTVLRNTEGKRLTYRELAAKDGA